MTLLERHALKSRSLICICGALLALVKLLQSLLVGRARLLACMSFTARQARLRTIVLNAANLGDYKAMGRVLVQQVK